VKRIGIETGHTVVDFGARVGHYSIPAAIAVGKDDFINMCCLFNFIKA
jgi:hypothetical protein